MQNLTNTLENIINLDEGDQKTFELALFSETIMDMKRGPEVLLITAILTEELNSKPRYSVAFCGGFEEMLLKIAILWSFLLGILTPRTVLNLTDVQSIRNHGTIMPYPSMGPKRFWTVQIILVECQLFWTGPICFDRVQIIMHRSKF